MWCFFHCIFNNKLILIWPTSRINKGLKERNSDRRKFFLRICTYEIDKVNKQFCQQVNKTEPWNNGSFIPKDFPIIYAPNVQIFYPIPDFQCKRQMHFKELFFPVESNQISKYRRPSLFADFLFANSLIHIWKMT